MSKEHTDAELIGRLLSVYGRKDEVELLGFLPQRTRILFHDLLSRGNHSQPVFRFPGSFLQVPILKRNSFRETASSASQ